jgi:hypothetical protein
MTDEKGESGLEEKSRGLERAGTIFSWVFAFLGLLAGYQFLGIVSSSTSEKTIAVVGLVGVILCCIGVLASQVVSALGRAFAVLDSTNRSASQGAHYLDRIGQMLHKELERADDSVSPKERDSGPPPISGGME